jgi:UDP-N-acetylmuramoyl-L-alanyl-D-glutamate--2,6-diaminopimelate ligase
MKLRSVHLTTLLEGLVENIEIDLEITGLALDSRQLKQGDAFLAVAGTHVHGLDFINQALEKKPSVIIYEPSADYSELQNEVPMIAVDNLRQYVSLIASRFYDNPSAELNITAITGTNGKTTCAYLLAQLLDAVGETAAMIGTIGSGRLNELQDVSLTTPDAISLQKRLAEFRDTGITHVVMEASSHALDQYRMDAVSVDTAAFTNLSQDHLDYHTDMSDYLKAKARLFGFASLINAVLNADEQDSNALLANKSSTLNIIEFSASNKPVNITAQSIKSGASATQFELGVNTKKYSVHTGLIGNFNVANLLLVIGVMHALDYKIESLLDALSTLSAPKGRMQRLGTDNTPTVVIDYAHTPDALEKALTTLHELKNDKLATVFGCGGERDKTKRALMGSIAERLADRVYLTDDNPRCESSEKIIADIRSGISEQAKLEIIPDRAKAIGVSIQQASAKDIVLIAGKGHEDYQIIGVDKIPFSDQVHAQSALNDWQELGA